MKIVERIIIITLLLAIIGGVAWLYFAVTHHQESVARDVAAGKYQIPNENQETDNSIPTKEDQADWRTYYPTTVPVTIGSTTVAASVADDLSERIKGLSDTPYLPEGLVKLFVFGANGSHSIWMKDMRYPIDVLWIEKEGSIVHIEESLSPDTFPESFSSPTPAWYVIEANAGFVSEHNITVGDQMTLVLQE